MFTAIAAAIALIIYCATLALCGILLWYFIDFLTMPENMKHASHLLLALILIMYGVSAVAGTYVPHKGDDATIQIPKGPPSIMR